MGNFFENIIKQHKKTERNEESQLQLLIETLGDGVILYTPEFRILFLNSAAEKILGLKKEEVVGRVVSPDPNADSKLSHLTQIMFPSLAPVVAQVSDSGWPQVMEITLEKPRLRLRTSLNRLTDATGNSQIFIKIFRDSTREEEMVESKREFLDVAAHQLRTPLTAIGWAFESLVRELGDKPNLKTIAEDGGGLATRALKIVNDLLDAARIEGGKFGYRFQNMELVSFIRNIVSQATPIAKEAGISLSFVSSNMETLTLTADPERIGMVLSNMIDNALKYNTKNGSATVSVEQMKDAPFVNITVQDTGIGIPEKHTQNLFKKFSRGENAVQVEPNGSGLGLYIAKNIIKNHGGEIEVRSLEGRGTTISFTLPLDPSLIPRKEMAY